MSTRARLFEFKGKEIYFVDLSNIESTGEFATALKETSKFRECIIDSGKSDLLMLVDVTSSILNVKVLDILKKNARLTKAVTKKEALVGLKAGTIYLNALNKFTGMDVKAFRSSEMAMDWLIE